MLWRPDGRAVSGEDPIYRMGEVGVEVHTFPGGTWICADASDNLL